MATKADLNQVLKVLYDNNHNKLIDIFVIINKMSSQHKEADNDYFVIFSKNDSIYNLSKSIKIESGGYVKNLNTIQSCVKKLIEMDILYYDNNIYAWIIGNVKEIKKNGYMELRKVFFNQEFYELKASEKKALFFSVYIMSLKNYRRLNVIILNLKNKNSNWMKIFRTDNEYFLKEIIQNLVQKYFTDISYKYRKLELEKNKYLEQEDVNKIKQELKFKFWFKPNEILNEKLGRKAKEIITDEQTEKQIKENLKEYKFKDPLFYNYLIDVKENYTIGNYRTSIDDEIVICLIRTCITLKLCEKKKITNVVLRRLNNEGEISSPARYICGIVKAHLTELNEGICTYEFGKHQL